MPAPQGAVQLLPLMRVVCVTSFGSLQNVLGALLAAIEFSLESFAPILKGSLASGSLIARRRLEL